MHKLQAQVFRVVGSSLKGEIQSYKDSDEAYY